MQRAQGRISTVDALRAWIEAKSAPGRAAIIGVCGYPGAGKTTLCRTLTAASANRVFHFEGDRFSSLSLCEREAQIAGALHAGLPADAAENPLDWYDWEAIKAALSGIRSRGRFTFPHGWNRTTGELDEPYGITLPAHGPAVLLCDCIYLLHQPVRKWLDALILVDTPLEVTLERGRARSKDPARAAYMERLTRIHAVPYFTAHQAAADMIFTNDEDIA
ncbi:hypothetical protein [Hoeflea ulvae]|uniref:Phosphoribulokinase/uridine kinase domain-containing protein n=1 Tax=Hoeflea ulvae TaxID=2983764 RepID=A0ABT3Y9G1_9HYPH|nr:hypothetical protein [Hoeflea ulvae]MCY0092521.1 hypothetical protein [Hoeflea ulvae]